MRRLGFRQRLAPLALQAAWFSVFPRAAEAHIVGARLGDFYAGALHPLTDPQDILLWLALGLLAGTRGPVRARWLVPGFPLALAAGAAIGLRFALVAPGPASNAAMTAALGLLLAVAVRLPGIALVLLAVFVGLLRGLANAGGIGPQTDPVLFTAGLTSAGYVVITLSTALAVQFHGQGGGWRGIALRACGSWIAAIGVMMGGFALAHLG